MDQYGWPLSKLIQLIAHDVHCQLSEESRVGDLRETETQAVVGPCAVKGTGDPSCQANSILNAVAAVSSVSVAGSAEESRAASW